MLKYQSDGLFVVSNNTCSDPDPLLPWSSRVETELCVRMYLTQFALCMFVLLYLLVFSDKHTLNKTEKHMLDPNSTAFSGEPYPYGIDPVGLFEISAYVLVVVIWPSLTWKITGRYANRMPDALFNYSLLVKPFSLMFVFSGVAVSRR